MIAVAKIILFKIVKNYILPKLLDELIDQLRALAAKSDNKIDDAAVDGIADNKDIIVENLKKVF